MAAAAADVPAIEAIDLVRSYQTHTGVLCRRRMTVEAVRANATLDVR